MKNYIEISTVVLFAILVHSALTASLVNMFMTLHGVGGGAGGVGAGVEDDFGSYDGHGGAVGNYGGVGNNNYDLNDYLNGAVARTTPSDDDDDDGSGVAYKWNDVRKVMQMGEPPLSSTMHHEQQQQSLSKKRPSIIPTTTTTTADNLSLEAYSAMLYKHRQASSLSSDDDSSDDQQDQVAGGMVDKRGAKQSKLRLIQQNKFRYMR
jgi:hypothetical protein